MIGMTDITVVSVYLIAVGLISALQAYVDFCVYEKNYGFMKDIIHEINAKPYFRRTSLTVKKIKKRFSLLFPDFRMCIRTIKMESAFIEFWDRSVAIIIFVIIMMWGVYITDEIIERKNWLSAYPLIICICLMDFLTNIKLYGDYVFYNPYMTNMMLRSLVIESLCISYTNYIYLSQIVNCVNPYMDYVLINQGFNWSGPYIDFWIYTLWTICMISITYFAPLTRRIRHKDYYKRLRLIKKLCFTFAFLRANKGNVIANSGYDLAHDFAKKFL